MRRVATAAAFRLDRLVFVDEWPLLVGMTLETRRIAVGLGTRLPQQPGAVDVMAILTFHKPFIHAVMKRLGKIRLGSHMASVTELRLALDQQFLLFGMMRRVAINATNVAAGMGRGRKVSLLTALGVATQAARVGLFPG